MKLYPPFIGSHVSQLPARGLQIKILFFKTCISTSELLPQARFYITKSIATKWSGGSQHGVGLLFCGSHNVENEYAKSTLKIDSVRSQKAQRLTRIVNFATTRSTEAFSMSKSVSADKQISLHNQLLSGWNEVDDVVSVPKYFAASSGALWEMSFS